MSTDDPRILITVEQIVNGQVVRSKPRTIKLSLWEDGRITDIGRAVMKEVSAMMLEIGEGK